MRKSRFPVTSKQLWHEYVWGKQTINQLGRKYGKSTPWIQSQFDKHIVTLNNPFPHKPQKINLVVDFTKLDSDYGVLVFRASNLKVNLCWIFAATERVSDYVQGTKFLKDKKWKVISLTIDGKPGVKEQFTDIPVQMCQWHQQQIIYRYITKNPKLTANRELFYLTLQLNNLKQEDFIKSLVNWKIKWQDFLKEKSLNPTTGKKCFTHRRTRSAVRSYEHSLPYLFTYQRYPELNMSNTTNSIEGTFSQLKIKLKCHRGIKGERKRKLIKELLIGQKLQRATQKFI